VALPQRDIVVFRVALCVALITILYLATTPKSFPVIEDVNDKVNHVTAFVALGLLADFSFPERGFDRRKILALLAYGLLIEVIQYFLPYRECSIYDLIADGAGLALYRLCIPAIRKLPWLRGRWGAHLRPSGL
jgi:VanZ family protein